MNKKILFPILFVLLVLPMSFAINDCYYFGGAFTWDDKTNQMVDDCGNATAATNSGTTNTSGVPYIAGNSARSFSGSSQYIDMGEPIVLDTNNFTIALYFKTSTTSIQYILDNTITADNRIFLRTQANGTLNLLVDDGPGVFLGYTTNTYNDGNWHSLVITRYANETLTMWVDNVTVLQTDGVGDISASGSIYLGKQLTAGYFSGQIDTALFLTKSVKQSEVENYGLCGDITCSTPPTPSTTQYLNISGYQIVTNTSISNFSVIINESSISLSQLNQSESGSFTNISNFNDGDLSTYAVASPTISTPAIIYENYSISGATTGLVYLAKTQEGEIGGNVDETCSTSPFEFRLRHTSAGISRTMTVQCYNSSDWVTLGSYGGLSYTQQMRIYESSFSYGTYFETTNGTIVTTINATRGDLINITANSKNYFTRKYYDINSSSNLNVSLGDGYYEIVNFYDRIKGTVLSGINISYNSKIYNASDSFLYLNPANFQILTKGYFNMTLSVNLTSLSNTSVNYSQIHDGKIQVLAKSLQGGTPISSFTATINNSLYNYSETLSTTNGLVEFNVSNNLTYNISIDAPDYGLDNLTFELTNKSANQTFYLASTNTITFNFYDQKTYSFITGINITVELIGDLASYNATTTNGSAFIDLITPSTYTIRYSANGYYEGFYIFTLENRTENVVDLYMLSSSDGIEVTATVIDEGDQVLENAVIKVLQYNRDTNSYDIVDIVTTNFEGESIVNIQNSSEYYKFTIEYPSGTVVLTTNPTYIYSDTITFQINTGSTGLERFRNVEAISYLMFYNNLTYRFSSYYNDGKNQISEACLKVYRIRPQGEELYNSSCSTSMTNTLYVGILNESSAQYISKLFVYYNEDEEFIDSYSIIIPDSLGWGQAGLLLIAFMTIAFSLIGVRNPSIAIILAPLPVALGILAGMITLPISVSVSLFCLAIFGVYLLGDRA